tara:strand:- start:550 stop:1140 length:591 start_codon:yes stop_codon:yes gene_type:complete
MKTLLALFVLLFSSSVVADDILDIQIEGISIGESLLDHLSEKEIKEELRVNKFFYDYLEQGQFGEVYLFKDFKLYDHVSFMVKYNDKKYTIHSIRGSISYDDNINECYSMQNEIVNEYSEIYKEAEKSEVTEKYPISFDPTEKSNIRISVFKFKSGDDIQVDCKYFEKNLKAKNNWVDSLSVSISTFEVVNWMSNY